MNEYFERMTSTEIKPVTVTVSDLQTGESLSSATATHTPPPGGTVKTITPSTSGSNITCLFGPFGATGNHNVKVQATGDAGSKPEVLFRIKIDE